MNKLAFLSKRLALTVPLLAFSLAMTACSRYNNSGGLATWGFILLALDVLAMIDVIRQPWGIGKKILWIAIIYIFPLGGLILYYLFAGRGKAST
ncbi:MAG TPA: PLD nuclease N-terminal domain-containing protein [Hymenobacter sp.]|jgi:hypothetical protein